MHLLRLIRWQNLLIIFLTQLLAWGCVIFPFAKNTGASYLLSPGTFLALSFSTICIAAAGYIINDYFDLKIDMINRPEKMVLEKQIPLKSAILLHSALNAFGLMLALAVARKAGHISWMLIQVACTLLLWFYSTRFKRRFMVGNVVVSLLTALTIVTLMVYEPMLHSYLPKKPFIDTAKGAAPNPVWVLGVYTFFAFMLTWMREIVKDMEDFKGDAEQGCLTMPIKWGLLKSVRFTQALGVIAMLPLIIAAIKLLFSGWWLLGIYTLITLVLPLALWLVILPKGATQEHYAKASRNLKVIMVSGIFSLIIYYLKAHA